VEGRVMAGSGAEEVRAGITAKLGRVGEGTQMASRGGCPRRQKFWVQEHEVTHAEYVRFDGSGPCRSGSCGTDAW